MIYDYNGIKVNFIQYGNGIDVVLLHGWGQNIEMMDPIGQSIKDYCRVTIIDFPGFGLSSEPNNIWNVDNYVEMLQGFLLHLNIKNPVIIGHSFGCRVAIKYANKYSVNKMVFTGAAGIKPTRPLSYYFKVYSYKCIKILLKLPVLSKNADKIKAHFGSSDYQSASNIMRGTLVNVVNEDLTKYLNKISCPVLLIWGSEDDATPLSDGYKMESLISDCALIKLNGSHYAYLENIQYFNNIVREFIK